MGTDFDAEHRQNAQKLSVAIAKKLASVIPYGGTVVGTGEAILDFLNARARLQQAQRLERFNAALLRPDEGTDVDLALADQLSEGDFTSLLNACMQDVEDEKAEFYACLMRSLLTRRVPKDDIRPIILTLNVLSAKDLAMLADAYVRTFGAVLRTSPSGVSAGMAIPKPGTPSHFGYRQMMERGLVHEGKFTEFGQRFVEMVVPSAMRTPAAVGIVTRLGGCAIYCQGLTGWQGQFAEQLAHGLPARGVEVGQIASIDVLVPRYPGAQRPFVPYRDDTTIVLVYDHVEDERKPALEAGFAKAFRSLPVILISSGPIDPDGFAGLHIVARRPNVTPNTIPALAAELADALVSSKGGAAAP